MEKKNLVIEASVEYLMLFQNTSLQLFLENKVYLGEKILTILTEPSSRTAVRGLNLDTPVSLWAKICSPCFYFL